MVNFLSQQGEKLIEAKMHPQTIIDGWRRAREVALKALDEAAVVHKDQSDAAFRQKLKHVARTTLSSKFLCKHKDYFADLVVDAILRLKGSGNLDAIQVSVLSNVNLVRII